MVRQCVGMTNEASSALCVVLAVIALAYGVLGFGGFWSVWPFDDIISGVAVALGGGLIFAAAEFDANALDARRKSTKR